MNSLLDYLFEKFDGKCQYCGSTVIRGNICEILEAGLQASIDHVIPTNQGGANDISNIVLCCRSCNASKGSKTIEKFREFCKFQANRIPQFTEEQKQWLAGQGFEFTIPPFLFYCERQETFKF